MLIAFLKNRVLACKYAIVGAIELVKNEPSIQLQTFISIGVTVAGFIFDISATQWMLQCFDQVKPPHLLSTHSSRLFYHQQSDLNSQYYVTEFLNSKSFYKMK